jgi:hypothetical protein
LDVAFNGDRMRQRDRNGIENLALLNRLAVSMLRQDKTIKAGVKCKRKTAGWNNDYLLHLLCNCQRFQVRLAVEARSSISLDNSSHRFKTSNNRAAGAG